MSTMITTPAQIRSGGDFEEYFLRRRHTGKPHDAFVTFEAAYKQAITPEAQGEDWDPLNPPTEPAQRLLEMIKKEAQDVNFRISPDVRLYRLIGTPCDSFHRVDAAIQYGDHRVLFDITLRRDKPGTPGIYIVRLDDVLDGNLEKIGITMAYDLLNQESRSILTDAALFMSSDKQTI